MSAPLIEIERVNALTDNLWNKVMEDEVWSEGSSPDDVRIDHYAIVAIVSGTDVNGDDIESPIWVFETKKPHVQLGIISAAYERIRSKFYQWLD